MKKHQILIGFAAESECLLERAKEKRIRKNADIMIGNDLSNFFFHWWFYLDHIPGTCSKIAISIERRTCFHDSTYFGGTI